MKITALELQKKDNKRYNLYLDNEFYMGIHEDVIVHLNLYKGLEIDQAYIEDILLEEELAKAKSTSVKYISYRLRSKKEIKEHLIKKGYSESIIEKVITFLFEYNFLNDLEFAKAFIFDKSTITRHSKMKIKYDLQHKGIHEALFNQAYETFEEDFEYDNCLYFANKKYKQLVEKKKYSDYEIKQKIRMFLSQKGFNHQIISDVLKDILSN